MNDGYRESLKCYCRWALIIAIAGVTTAVIFGRNDDGHDSSASSLPDQSVNAVHDGSTGHPPDASDRNDGHHEGGGGHFDPFSLILLELALIIFAAMLGRWIAENLNQPSVLGELCIGVVIGNIGYWLQFPLFILVMHLNDASEILKLMLDQGLSVVEAADTVFPDTGESRGDVGARIVEIITDSGGTQNIIMVFALWLFSNHGVILLLFMVGLSTKVEDMLKVGPKASMVAVIGVVVPFLMGLGAGKILLPDSSTSVHLFLAATLCATSVGITARVFKDLNKLSTSEAQIILGAAVIDDILGLIILAIVVGIVGTGSIRISEVIRICLLSFAFFYIIIRMGDRLVRWHLPLASELDRHHSKLLFPLMMAFLMSWLANLIGLASIVGAFAAGLILHEELFVEHQDKRTLHDMIAPLETLFAPVFFVLMGMQVNLSTFLMPGTLWLAFAFTIAAIIGKIVSGIPVGKDLDRLSVGIGMVPRGEVGLIFASVGKGLGVVTDAVFSAVVIMVIVTTLITPVALKWSLDRTR